MRLKLNLTGQSKPALADAAAWSRPGSAHAPARFKPFLVPLGQDPLADVKPWAAPVRAAFLFACISLTWAVPIGAWLLL